MKNAVQIIAGLKDLVVKYGPIWPNSTHLAGYSESGPYHCGDCEYLKGLKHGAAIRDSQGRGRCNQPVMLADPQTRKDANGFAIVNIETGCCEFVEPIKKGK